MNTTSTKRMGKLAAALTATVLTVLAAPGATSAAPGHHHRHHPTTKHVTTHAARGATTGREAVTIGSYNIKFSVSDRAAGTIVTKFTGLVDVAGLQEFGGDGRGRVLDNLVGRESYRPVGSGDPIVWNPDKVDFVKGWGSLFAKGRSVAKVAGRRDHMPANVGTVVRFMTRETHQRFTVIDVHVPSHIDVGGRPRPGQYDRLAMANEVLTSVSRIVASERRSWGDVFVVGDMNVDQRHDAKVRYKNFPVRKFADVGLASMWTSHLPSTGSHGKRLIDNIFSNVRAARQNVLTSYRYSDHKPVYGVFVLGN